MASTPVPIIGANTIAGFNITVPFTTTDQFTFSFPYLDKTHFKIEVKSETVLDALDYEFVSDYLIQLTTVGRDKLNALYTSGTVDLIIYRSTQLPTRLTDFQNGANLTDAELDLQANQTFYLIQEAYDTAIAGSLGKNPVSGAIDAEGAELVDIADPTGLTSAVNLNTLLANVITPNYTEGDTYRSGRLVFLAGDLYRANKDVVNAPAVMVGVDFDTVLTVAQLAQIVTNQTNIATNASNIATNVTNISTNQTNISTNASNIATNVTNISTNASAILTNGTAIGVNAGGISNNAADIAQSEADILAINASNTGAPRMIGGLIQSANLPSYVDDVIEVANYVALPLTGETGKLYITIDNDLTFRWSGSVYVQLAGGGGLDQWITATSYSVADVVWLSTDNKIYRCTTNNADVSFIPSNWQELSENPLEGTVGLSTGGNNVSVTDNDGTNILRAESEVLYIEDFKENDHSIFTDTANVVSSSNTTSTAIGKYRSMVVTVTTGVLGNGTLSPEVIVTDYMKEFGTVGLNSNTRFNGNLGDMVMYVEFFNGVDWTTLPTDSFNFRNGSKPNRFLINLDDTCTKFRYTPRVVVAGSYVLEIGMIKLVSNPLPTAESVQSESFSVWDFQGYGSTNTAIPYYISTGVRKDTTGDLIAVDYDNSTLGASITALKKCTVNMSLSHSVSVSGLAGITLNSTQLSTAVEDVNDVNVLASSYQPNANTPRSVSVEIELDVGDVLRPHTGTTGTQSTNAVSSFSVTATASSSNVVFEGEDTDNIGLISMQAAELATPKNHLYCNGDAVSRNGYADLFAKVGTTYGVGDGSTTFNLPDMRGYFPRGYDDGRGVDAARVFGTEQAGQSNHLAQVHEFTQAGASATNVTVPSDGTFTAYIKNYVTSEGMRFRTHGRETRPHNIAVKFYIRYAEKEILSVPVTNLVENVYSGVFDGSAGASVVVTSQNANAFTVTQSAVGVFIVDYTNLGLGVIPAFTADPMTTSASNYIVETYLATTTSVTVRCFNTGGTATNFDFSLKLHLQGADYRAPKGYFLGNMASTVATTDGVEYRVGDKTIDGKPVWARSYDISGTFALTTFHGIDIIDTGLVPLSVDGFVRESGTGNWFAVPVIGGSTVIGYISYVDTTGVIGLQNGGVTTDRIRLTFKYTK